ncbi:ParB/RepB/Spo0J family partition protein [Thalassococcus sp. BH17M4-6]|uniref:ParB/RepB/Spo0J family partition protein n=1 Tax=Thalassococcus sp. BH17M4-6 TaxID=3413148 RepID=UPI003BC1D192
MAKRKRLTPPNPGYLDTAPEPQAKGMFAAAPIADVAREASSAAALDEMADTLNRARSEGRMVLTLPLGDIQLDYLVRDRTLVDDADMTALMESLRARGQQTPVEVADLGGGRFGLISGWRRCEALRRLAAETGEDRFTSVLALLRRPEEASDAYLAMVEENEIRVGLSYYERARIVAKAAENGVYASEKAALAALFAAASRPKRSKIGSFLTIVAQLDGALRYPEAIGERSGLTLSRALEDDPGLAPRLRTALAATPPADPQAEQALIDAALKAPATATKQTLIRPQTPPPPAPVTNIFADPQEGERLSEAQARSVRTGGTEIAPGVWMRVFFNGDIAISGDNLPADLHSELRAWLTDRL